MNDDFYMRLAIKQAWKYQLLTYPNPAVGCVIVSKNGDILSIAAHQKAGTFHAELRAVIAALSKLNDDFSKLVDFSPNDAYNYILSNHNGLLSGAKVYVTLEPCSHFGRTPPCANLLKALKIGELFVGVMDANSHGGAAMLASSGVCVISGVCERECKELIEPFMLWSGLCGQSANFTLFKTAMSLNGVISGQISGELARKHCHEIRSLLDLIVIGGNTARLDRPLLDARFSLSKKAPNVLIYSKQSSFDESIPLFSVPNRKVQISGDLNEIKKHSFVMIEGVGTLLNALKNDFHWLLIYQNASFLQGEHLSSNLKLRIMQRVSLGADCALWCKINR